MIYQQQIADAAIQADVHGLSSSSFSFAVVEMTTAGVVVSAVATMVVALAETTLASSLSYFFFAAAEITAITDVVVAASSGSYADRGTFRVPPFLVLYRHVTVFFVWHFFCRLSNKTNKLLIKYFSCLLWFNLTINKSSV